MTTEACDEDADNGEMMMRPGILRIQRIMQTQITITAQMHPKKVQRTHPQTVTVLLTAAVQDLLL